MIKMILNENILAKPIIEEISREKLPEGVLCRVSYPICDVGKRNANGRVYEDAVWEKVHEDGDLKEKLDNRALFGHAEHPEQTQSNLEKTSHVIFEMWKDGDQEWQKFDVLDTPTGRIVDCLLRAGCRVGCSTRAEGDLEEAEDDEGTFQRVIPESYRYVTTDFTADPSTAGSIPHDMRRNIVTEVKGLLENNETNDSEKEFAQLILEAVECKDGECVMDSVKKIVDKVGEKKLLAKEDMKENKVLEKNPKITETDVSKGTKALIKLAETYAPGNTVYWTSPGAEVKIIKTITPDDPDFMKYVGSLTDFMGSRPESPFYLVDFGGDVEVVSSDELTENKTVSSLLKEGAIKEGIEVKYNDKDAKVDRIEESKVTLLIGEMDPTTVAVDGNAHVSVNPEGLITILSAEVMSDMQAKEPEEVPDEVAVPEELPEELPEEPIEDELEVELDNTGLEMPAEDVEDEIPESKRDPEKLKKLKPGKKYTEEEQLKRRKADHAAIVGESKKYKVGDTYKIVEGEHKDKKGKIAKIDETGITIALDDGTTVNIEDPSAVNITVTPPAPKEEIEAVPEEEFPGATEEEVADIEAEAVEDEIPDEKFESKKVKEDISRKEFLNRQVKRLKKEKADFEKVNQRKLDQVEKELKALATLGSGLKKESKTEEARLPSKGGISDKLADGNLLQDKDGAHWVISELTDTNLLVTQPGEAGTEKSLGWDEVPDWGFTKLAEKVDERELEKSDKGVMVREKDGGWGVFVVGDGEDRLLTRFDEKDVATKRAEKYAGDEGVTYKGVVETIVNEGMVRAVADTLKDRGYKFDFGELAQHIEALPEDDYNALEKAVETGDEDEIAQIIRSVGFTESKVEEAANIKSMYKSAGLPAPDGKGIHTKAFHELAIKVAKGYVEGGDSPQEALDKAYPTAMEQLGKEKAVKKPHQKSESKVDEGRGEEIYQEALEFSKKEILSQMKSKGGDYDAFGIRDTLVKQFGISKQEAEDILMDVAGEDELDLGSRPNFESISTTVKEIKDLKIQEASTRAERDKAIELLEELVDEKQKFESKVVKDKAFEIKMLVNKMKQTLEVKEQEVDALRSKLEEKAKFAAGQKKLVSETRTNSLKGITDLTESVAVEAKSMKDGWQKSDETHAKELDQLCEELKLEEKQHKEVLQEKIKETEKSVTKSITKKVTERFIKSFVEFRLSESGSKIDENSRALLEKSKSLEDVDNLLDEIVDASRRSALHSEAIRGIRIPKHIISDPEGDRIKRSVNNVFEGLNG